MAVIIWGGWVKSTGDAGILTQTPATFPAGFLAGAQATEFGKRSYGFRGIHGLKRVQ
jgi:hypothetical protein